MHIKYNFETYLIVYISRKNEIKYRLVKYLPLYDINTYTSMGWYIVDIQIFYKGKFIKLDEYQIELKKRLKKYEKIDKKIIKKVSRYKKNRGLIHRVFKKYY